jgi:hypothetical protein
VGAQPNAGITLDRSGNIYGTAYFYGIGYGTVYKLTNRNGVWMPSVLYTFLGGNDGANPASRVVFGPDGALYAKIIGEPASLRARWPDRYQGFRDNSAWN